MKSYLFQILGAVLAVAYLVAGIYSSTNSTASIGFLFVPVAAAIGAFVGDAIKYIIELIQNKRSHSIKKSALIFVFLVACSYQYIKSHIKDEDMNLARNPSTPAETLVSLLKRNDSVITHEIVANPSLPQEELEQVIKEHLTDYYIMSGAIQHPKLNVADMEQIAALRRGDFKGEEEYEVYQTYVWAPLVKNKNMPENLTHQLAAKDNPQHFLILALLDSPFVSCDEKKRFLPQTNTVLESAIQRSLEAQSCLR